MVPRYFIYFGMIALFVAVVNIGAIEMDNKEVQDRVNPAIKALAKIIGKLFAGAAAGCLIEAATECKDDLAHPSKALQCGKEFLEKNKGKCAAGK